MSILNQRIEDYLKKDGLDDELVYEEIFEYDYPREEVVPESWYCAKLMDIRRSTNKNNQKCIDVYYKVFQPQMMQAYNNGYIDKIPYYFIMERCRINTPHYGKLCSALKKASGLNRLTFPNLIGTIEGFQIIYKKGYSIGSIEDRRPLTISNDWFDDDAENTEEYDEDESYEE